jgi:hypothetical protein
VSGSSSAEIGGGFGILSQGSIYEQRLTELMARVSTAVERNENRLEEQDRREAIALEWKQLALVCDRFLSLFPIGFFIGFSIFASMFAGSYCSRSSSSQPSPPVSCSPRPRTVRKNKIK